MVKPQGKDKEVPFEWFSFEWSVILQHIRAAAFWSQTLLQINKSSIIVKDARLWLEYHQTSRVMWWKSFFFSQGASSKNHHLNGADQEPQIQSSQTYAKITFNKSFVTKTKRFLKKRTNIMHAFGFWSQSFYVWIPLDCFNPVHECMCVCCSSPEV